MDKKFEEVINQVNPEILENKDVDLLDEGIIDSLQIMILVSSLCEAYSIDIDPDDITPEAFCTVESIWNLVKKYME